MGILFKTYTATAASGGLDLHQLRHSAATHLGGQKVPLQLIMAKTRHKSPRTVMRYVKPGDEAVAESPACSDRPVALTEPGRQPIAPGVPGTLSRLDGIACT